MGRFSYPGGRVEYSKPHLNYNEQVQLLIDRGLDVPNRAVAVRALKRIGYYRLSAYTYPLREQGDCSAEGRAARSERFVAGAAIEDAIALHDFDEKLRAVLFAGLQRLEVGFRVQVGYRLGKAGTFGHIDRRHLDPSRCAEPARGESSEDAHEAWLGRYEQLQRDAKNEDFVRHFIMNYDGKVPVWVATEFMTFGCLTALYALLTSGDATAICTNLGVRNRDVLHGWLKALNVLRNHCAHNGRVWNRATVYPPVKPPKQLVHERLHHLGRADNDRIYFLAAVCAHVLIEMDPQTDWPTQFVTTMRKFRPVHGMTPENTMGFPSDWTELAIWQRARG